MKRRRRVLLRKRGRSWFGRVRWRPRYPTTATMLAFGAVLAVAGGLGANLENFVLAVLMAFGLDLLSRMDAEAAAYKASSGIRPRHTREERRSE